MIISGRVRASWWRKEGHNLAISDVEEILKEKPEVLVVGTGYSGLMKVQPEVVAQLKKGGTEVIIDRTERACEIFNEFSRSKNAAAALHLTC